MKLFDIVHINNYFYMNYMTNVSFSSYRISINWLKRIFIQKMIVEDLLRIDENKVLDYNHLINFEKEFLFLINSSLNQIKFNLNDKIASLIDLWTNEIRQQLKNCQWHSSTKFFTFSITKLKFICSIMSIDFWKIDREICAHLLWTSLDFKWKKAITNNWLMRIHFTIL